MTQPTHVVRFALLTAPDPTAGPASRAFQQWRSDLEAITTYPSVVAKLSGLGAFLGAGVPVTAQAIAPFVEVALDASGPTR